MTDVGEMPLADESAASAVRSRAAHVLRPAGALERLDEVASWLAGWQRTDRPRVERPACVVFVGDHGVACHGVSAYPQSVTSEMLRALDAGVATASALTREVGATMRVVDVGAGDPTGDLSVEPALDEQRFEQCWRAGERSVAELDVDLLVLGEMGIGNTTAAAAVAAALFGGETSLWVGRGTGVDDEALARKCEVVDAARRRVAGASPREILSEVGGSELVALAGAANEARRRSIPVVLDGFVVAAALAPLEVERQGTLDHCIAAHLSPEPGHALLLERLGKEPLLDLGLRLGEASGALLAVPLIRMAAAAVVDVATFEEWGISQ